MGLDGTSKRRWFGALTLAGAIAMLVAGETLLRGRLKGMVFLGYWLACLVLTGLAVVMAFRDLRAVQEGVIREQRDLLEDTLKDIENEAKSRRRKLKRNGGRRV